MSRYLLFAVLCAVSGHLSATQLLPWHVPVTSRLAPQVLATDAADRVYVAAPTGLIDGEPFLVLQRVTPSGAVDTSFRVTGIAGTANFADSVAIGPDGSVFVAFTQQNTGTRSVVRLDAAGNFDPAWTVQFNGLVPGAFQLLPSPQGLVVRGGFTGVNGTPRPGLARLGWNGVLDAAFAPALPQRPSFVAVAGDGAVYAQDTSPALRKLNATTGADVWGFALGSDGERLAGSIGSVFYTDDTFPGSGLTKRDGATAGPLPFASVPNASLRVIAADWIFQYEPSATPGARRVRRYSAVTGEVDATWPDQQLPNIALRMTRSGEGVALSGLPLPQDANESGLFRLAANGSVDATYRPVLRQTGDVRRAIRAADGSVVVHGDFDRVASSERRGFARFGSGTLALDAGWAPATSIIAAGDAEIVGTSVVAAGDFRVDGEPERRTLLRIDLATGEIDAGWPSPATYPFFLPVPELAPSIPGQVILARLSGTTVCGGAHGSFTRVSVVDPCIVDSSFTGTTSGEVWDVQPASDGTLLALGSPTSFFATVIERRGVDGALAPGWHVAEADSLVLTMLDSPDGAYVAGAFTSIDGVARTRIARLRTDGTVDPAWSFTTTRFPTAMALAADGDLVVALFDSVGDTRLEKRSRVDGAADPSLVVAIEGIVNQIEPVAGKLLLAGQFTRVAGQRRDSVALIGPDDGLFADSFE